MNNKLNKILWIPRVLILINALYVVYLAFQYSNNEAFHIVIYAFRFIIQIVCFILSFRAPVQVGIFMMLVLLVSLLKDILSNLPINPLSFFFYFLYFVLASLLIILPRIIKLNEKKKEN